jgi:hypothetical protein
MQAARFDKADVDFALNLRTLHILRHSSSWNRVTER